MKRVITIIVGIVFVLTGVSAYLFSYGDWSELAGTEGYNEDSWYYTDDPEKNLNINGFSFKDYNLGYDQWKVVAENVLDHGRYSVTLSEGNFVEDINSMNVIYEFPEQTPDMNGFEQIIDHSTMQQVTAFTVEYKEPTAGWSSFKIYGKRRRIMDLMAHFINDEDIGKWNERFHLYNE